MNDVLVVEDEKHLADGLRYNLEAEGYTVDTVSDGESALSLLLDDKRSLRRGGARRNVTWKGRVSLLARAACCGTIRPGSDVDCARTSRRCAPRF